MFDKATKIVCKNDVKLKLVIICNFTTVLESTFDYPFYFLCHLEIYSTFVYCNILFSWNILWPAEVVHMCSLWVSIFVSHLVILYSLISFDNRTYILRFDHFFSEEEIILNGRLDRLISKSICLVRSSVHLTSFGSVER